MKIHKSSLISACSAMAVVVALAGFGSVFVAEEASAGGVRRAPVQRAQVHRAVSPRPFRPAATRVARQPRQPRMAAVSRPSHMSAPPAAHSNGFAGGSAHAQSPAGHHQTAALPTAGSLHLTASGSMSGGSQNLAVSNTQTHAAPPAFAQTPSTAGNVSHTNTATNAQHVAALTGNGTNTHALTHSGVANAAENLGEQQQKLKDANQTLKTAETGLKGDQKKLSQADQAAATANKNVADKKTAEANAFKTDFADLSKLQADKAKNAPPAVIAADQANLIAATKAASAAHIATTQASTAATKAQANETADKAKVASDEKAVAQDKKTVTTDKTDVAQAKQTLGDKTKIAQEKQQIQQLKGQLAAQNGQGGQGGQGSSSGGQQDASGGGQGSSSGGNSAGDSSTSASNAAPSGSSASGGSTSPASTQTSNATAVQAATQPSQMLARLPNTLRATSAAMSAPRFLLVAFQPSITAADLAVFLKTYNVSIVDLPTTGGPYKLRVADDYPADQMPQLIESMKSQSDFVSNVVAN